MKKTYFIELEVVAPNEAPKGTEAIPGLNGSDRLGCPCSAGWSCLRKSVRR